MTPIATALSATTLGIDVTVQNLTMFPLLSEEGETRAPYLTLDEALSEGWARITEIGEAGRVPELRFLNQADRPVFVLDGEELLGAKQNRVVNLSILVPAECTLTIPVSCVEAGRWHARSRAFASAPRTQYARGRAAKMRQVTASMLSVGARVSDQSAVWADIADKSARLQAQSPTSAMEAMFERYGEPIEAFVEGLTPVAGQVGALFAIGGRIAGLDLFDSAPLLRKLLPKIVRSYALDALDPLNAVVRPARERRRAPETIEERAAGAASRRGHRSERSTDLSPSLRFAATHFLAAAIGAEGKSMPALGLGHDVRVDVPGLAAAALVHNERVVHLSAFAC